jgi:hypothetical protein
VKKLKIKKIFGNKEDEGMVKGTKVLETKWV